MNNDLLNLTEALNEIGFDADNIDTILELRYIDGAAEYRKHYGYDEDYNIPDGDLWDLQDEIHGMFLMKDGSVRNVSAVCSYEDGVWGE